MSRINILLFSFIFIYFAARFTAFIAIFNLIKKCFVLSLFSSFSFRQHKRRHPDKRLYVEVQEEKLFPDLIDTPQNKPGRVWFQKYRDFASIQTSPWVKKENIPYDYVRIYQFQNFDRIKKRVLKELEDAEEAQPGW